MKRHLSIQNKPMFFCIFGSMQQKHSYDFFIHNIGLIHEVFLDPRMFHIPLGIWQ